MQKRNRLEVNLPYVEIRFEMNIAIVSDQPTFIASTCTALSLIKEGSSVVKFILCIEDIVSSTIGAYETAIS